MLTNVQIRNAKPARKPYKMSDERGLFLLVAPSGGKWWRFTYRFQGKQKTISMGVYPDVPLAKARARREAARQLVADHVDPSEQRKSEKAAREDRDQHTFEAVAREWYAKHEPRWAVTHSEKVIKRLEKNIFPWLGKKAISEITPPDVLACLRRIEMRGALDTAHRAHQNCGQVFRYAVATGRTMRDPTGDLRGALPPVKHTHYAAIVEPAEVGELLRAIDGFRGTFIVQCALKLAPLLFVRPGELRKARWAEFDLDKGEWRYLVTKTKIEHLVPLASQVLAVLRELKALTGDGEYLFPGIRRNGKPMSDAAVNAALRRMGYDTRSEITGHGFRAIARTILHQDLGVPPEVIEHQLAHRVPDMLGTAYNRTKFLPARRAMMQKWANHLDKLKLGGKVLPPAQGDEVAPRRRRALPTTKATAVVGS